MNVGSAKVAARWNVHGAMEQEANVVISAMEKENSLALIARKEIAWRENFESG